MEPRTKLCWVFAYQHMALVICLLTCGRLLICLPRQWLIFFFSVVSPGVGVMIRMRMENYFGVIANFCYKNSL